mmetsp:Transcript_46922/g.124700  ORF Transcript_46922/g.124700 Transcript_46922/m.124700 type:complete len:91 (+) Transcript_46922:44-316(+)
MRQHIRSAKKKREQVEHSCATCNHGPDRTTQRDTCTQTGQGVRGMRATTTYLSVAYLAPLGGLCTVEVKKYLWPEGSMHFLQARKLETWF